MEATVTIAREAEAGAALARSAVHRFLSQALTYPTPQTVEQLREQDLPLAVALAEPLGEGVGAALASASAELEATDASRLEADYRATFSHVHSADCPMYETDFTAGDVWRQTRELADLAGFYRAFGMDQRLERPDHVTVELEFLHLVAYKTAWALVHGDEGHADVCAEAEKRFLTDHALTWVPGFAARVAALAPEGPYRAFGELALALLRAEAARLGFDIDESLAPQPKLPEAEALQDTGLCAGET